MTRYCVALPAVALALAWQIQIAVFAPTPALYIIDMSTYHPQSTPLVPLDEARLTTADLPIPASPDAKHQDIINVMHDIYDGKYDLVVDFKEIVGDKDFQPIGLDLEYLGDMYYFYINGHNFPVEDEKRKRKEFDKEHLQRYEHNIKEARKILNLVEPKDIAFELNKAFKDIKEKMPIKGSTIENIFDLSKDVEHFLTYVLVAESNDIMTHLFVAAELHEMIEVLDSIAKDGHVVTKYWEKKYLLIQGLYALNELSQSQVLSEMDDCIAKGFNDEWCTSVVKRYKQEYRNVNKSYSKDEAVGHLYYVRQTFEYIVRAHDLLNAKGGKKPLQQPKWIAELLIGECLLHDSKSITEAMKVMRGKAKVKTSRKYLYDLLLHDLHKPTDGIQLETHIELRVCKLRESYRDKDSHSEPNWKPKPQLDAIMKELPDLVKKVYIGDHTQIFLLDMAEAHPTDVPDVDKSILIEFRKTKTMIKDIDMNLEKFSQSYVNQLLRQVYLTTGTDRIDAIKHLLYAISKVDNIYNLLLSTTIEESETLGRTVADLAIVKSIVESNSKLLEQFSLMLNGETVSNILKQCEKITAEVKSVGPNKTIGHKLIELQEKSQAVTADDLNSLWTLIQSSYETNFVPITMQYGFVKLNTLAADHHFHLPDGFTTFSKECEKNTQAQDKLWQHLVKEKPDVAFIETIFHAVFVYKSDHLHNPIGDTNGYTAELSHDEAIRYFYILLMTVAMDQEMQATLILDLSMIDNAIQSSEIMGKEHTNLQQLANCEHVKYIRRRIQYEVESHTLSMSSYFLFSYNQIPIKVDKLVVNRKNVATKVLTIREHIIKGTLSSHESLLVDLHKDLEKSQEEMTYISATVQCSLRDMKEPIKKTHFAVAAQLDPFFIRSEKTCANLESLYAKRLKGDDWNKILSPLIKQANEHPTDDNIKQIMQAIVEVIDNDKQEIDETLRMEVVFMDSLREKMATRESEWTWIRMTSVQVMIAWVRAVDDKKWKAFLGDPVENIHKFDEKFHAPNAVHNDAMCMDWNELLTRVEIYLRETTTKPEEFFEKHKDLQTKLVKIDYSIVPHCSNHYAIDNNFRPAIFHGFELPSLGNEQDRGKFHETQQKVNLEFQKIVKEVIAKLKETNGMLKHSKSYAAYQPFDQNSLDPATLATEYATQLYNTMKEISGTREL